MNEAGAIDRETFRGLVEQYQAEAVGHAIAILGDREDARDAVQEAFLDVWRAKGRFDSGRKFYPWFYTILRHRCFKLLANRKRQASCAEMPQIFAVGIEGSREDTLALDEALRELAPEDRELITLRHLDGLSYAQLAEYLGIPVGTVMSRLFHARRKLRGKLEAKS